MATKSVDIDGILSKLAADVVKTGTDVRTHVRDLTIKGLQTRELSLDQIRQVIRSVTDGISQGSTLAKVDPAKVLQDACPGMDDALRKAVQAGQIALQQLTEHEVDFADSRMKKALADMERMEDEFLSAVKDATERASGPMRQKWEGALGGLVPGHTETGAQVEALMEKFGEPARKAMREQREAGLRVAHLLTQNFATLASGVLMGLSDGLHNEGAPRKKKSTGD